MLTIQIIVDNQSPPSEISEDYPELENQHGLSVFIDSGDKKILFDTAWNGNLLLRNCEILNIPLLELDAIFISHQHWDHIGGLPTLLEYLKKKSSENPKVKVPHIFVPKNFSINQMKEIQILLDDMRLYVENKDPRFVRYIDQFQILEEISGDTIFASTGTFKNESIYIHEHSLVIKKKGSERGILIIGCAHAGIKKPFEAASDNLVPVDTIIGGIHEFNDENVLNELVKRSLKKAHIGHCTKYFELLENNSQLNASKIYTGYTREI